jgi:hypothetical protein
MYLGLKVGLSAILIVAIGEIAKRNPLLGGLVASLPLVSLLAMIWLYIDTDNSNAVADLSMNIFWLVLPSLVLFIVLPFLIHKGWAFYPALGAAVTATCGAYAAMMAVLGRFGIRI